MSACENVGTSVGGKPCPKKATHRVTFWQGDDEYESFLCPECFLGFREEMIASGLAPKNEAAQAPSDEHQETKR